MDFNCPRTVAERVASEEERVWLQSSLIQETVLEGVLAAHLYRVVGERLPLLVSQCVKCVLIRIVGYIPTLPFLSFLTILETNKHSSLVGHIRLLGGI